MKNSNFKSMFNKLVNNKMTLYIVALIAFLSLYTYIMNSEFSAVLLFFLTGLITYKFTKNMAVVLGTSFLVTSLTNISKDVFKFQEGFEEGKDEEEESTRARGPRVDSISQHSQSNNILNVKFDVLINGTNTNTFTNFNTEKIKNEIQSLAIFNDDTLTNSNDSLNFNFSKVNDFNVSNFNNADSLDDILETYNSDADDFRLAMEEIFKKNFTGNEDVTLSNYEFAAQEPFKNRKSKKSGYQNQLKLNPSLYNMPNKEQMQKQLGKATEMEQAYDNLEKIMGKDNIKSISTDTKDLIKQQNELIKQLKTMTPALNDAMASLGNLDLGKLSNMFNSATKNLSELKSNE